MKKKRSLAESCGQFDVLGRQKGLVDTDRDFGASFDLLERATLVALYPIVLFPADERRRTKILTTARSAERSDEFGSGFRGVAERDAGNGGQVPGCSQVVCSAAQQVYDGWPHARFSASGADATAQILGEARAEKFEWKILSRRHGLSRRRDARNSNWKMLSRCHSPSAIGITCDSVCFHGSLVRERLCRFA